MVANWNAVVGHDDTVWHLGDFAHGADAKHIRSIFHRLNGIKRLVIGHDDRAETLDLPWAVPPTHLATVGVDGVRVVMCHYGLRVWPGMRRKAIARCGHSHGRLPGTSMSLDAGVDCKGFAPVGMDGIRRRLRTLPEHPDPEGDPGGLAGGRGMTGDNERDGVAARRKGVDFAIENTRLSGGTVSMEARRLLEEWVTGKLTDDELLAASALGKRPTKTLPAAPVEPADEIEEENGK